MKKVIIIGDNSENIKLMAIKLRETLNEDMEIIIDNKETEEDLSGYYNKVDKLKSIPIKPRPLVEPMYVPRVKHMKKSHERQYKFHR